jgi:hypothetical protein
MRARAVRRSLAAVAGALALTGLTTGGAASARAVPAAAPLLTPAEHAAAVLAPALVSIQVTWEGYVRQQVGGALLDDQSVTVTGRCEGAAVSSDGYLVTTGDCVDPAAVTAQFYQQVAQRRVAKGLATADQVPALVADMFGNASVVGSPVDQPPKRTVTVNRGVATTAEGLPATVVSVDPGTAGDVALLKIERSNEPIVALAADVKVGLNVLTVEYPDTSQQQPSAPTVRLGSIATVEPHLTAYAGPTTGRAGAPVVTDAGDLVGLVNKHQPANSIDLLTAASDIADQLAGPKGSPPKVNNTLGPVDTAYRDGLSAFIAGRYTDAIEKFDAVLAIVPSHKQAHAFRDQAQALREAQGGPEKADNSLLQPVTGHLGTIGPLLAAGVLVAIGLFLVRRRAHPSPQSPTKTQPVQDPSGRVKLVTPRYCTNCSRALPDEPEPLCPNCGQRSGRLAHHAE